MQSNSKLSSVILWSVISAAFIGPGTITTAITAGSQFNIDLLWAVVFATFACIVLQEVSARITISTGTSFGKTLDKKFGLSTGRWIKWMVAMPVLLGCAAYEAGNILGGVAGLNVLYPIDTRWLTIILTIFAAIILWKGGSRYISIVMTGLVGMMGVAFFILAFQTQFDIVEILKASVVPNLPQNSEWLALALVGTTIVPYNIFIGSAISKGSTIPLMRIGLFISVIIGGLITACILFAGTLTGTFTSFPELALILNGKLGVLGTWALGIGLFAAGFSSAITSPYAASLITSTVLDSENKKFVTLTWLTVLLVGFAFGISGLKPIPIILTVQALNGFVLPLLAYFLIIVVNDSKIVKKDDQPGVIYNFILLCILLITLLIGFNNIDKSIVNAFQMDGSHPTIVSITTILLLIAVILQLIKQTREH